MTDSLDRPANDVCYSPGSKNFSEFKIFDYGTLLANAALDIGAIKLSPNVPVTWACGSRMPIYNDNRMLLSKPEYRAMIGHGLKQLIIRRKEYSDNDGTKFDCGGAELKYHSAEFDYIGATPTAGIAPACLAAIATGKPLLLVHEDKSYVFDKECVESVLSGLMIPKEIDVVASSSPLGIIPAIYLADKSGLPMIYVRKQKKDHGLEKRIEGVLLPGQKVFLLNYDMFGDEKGSPVRAICEDGGIIAGQFTSCDILRMGFSDISGKRVIMIEDLISTGGSSVKEALKVREKGAIVDYCLSIFNYDFEAARKAFSDENIKVDSIIYYPNLIEVASSSGKISDSELLMLKDWRVDPFGWGEKNGFPKVER